MLLVQDLATCENAEHDVVDSGSRRNSQGKPGTHAQITQGKL